MMPEIVGSKKIWTPSKRYLGQSGQGEEERRE